MSRYGLGFGSALALAAMFGAAVADARSEAPAAAVAPSYFGMHMHYAATGTPWPAVAFGSWRLWDAYVTWRDLEKNPREWQFATLDRYVALAAEQDVELLLPLGMPPQWASARPGEPSAYGPGHAAEPKRLDDWRRYVRTVAMRYKGKISQYEIWNEPELKKFFSGDVEQLLTLAREAYRTLKEVDPGAIVVSPSAAGDGGVAWLDRYLSKGGGEWADVIGFHFYVNPQLPEAMPAIIAKVQLLLKRHGLSAKPLWNTETGWLIANAESPIDPARVGWPSDNKVLTSAEAEGVVARAHILGRAAGLSRFYWYAWDGEEMGLAERGTPKPAAHAYDQTYRWLVGSTLGECSAANGLWVCDLVKGRARQARLVWSTNGPQAWRAPQGFGAGYETLRGERKRLDARTALEVGPRPILVKNDVEPWSE